MNVYKSGIIQLQNSNSFYHIYCNCNNINFVEPSPYSPKALRIALAVSEFILAYPEIVSIFKLFL